VESLADQFHLSTEERQQLLGSGQQTVIRNRAGWARTYLEKAGLATASPLVTDRSIVPVDSLLRSRPRVL
jgi:restriction endonuclease Mrr